MEAQIEPIEDAKAREIQEWLVHPACDAFLECLRAEIAASTCAGLTLLLDDPAYFIHKPLMSEREGKYFVAAAKLRIVHDGLIMARKPEMVFNSVTVKI